MSALTTEKTLTGPLSGLCRYWFDDGRGGVFIYGEVRSAGHQFITVQWENGRRQRVRIGTAAHDCIEKVDGQRRPITLTTAK